MAQAAFPGVRLSSVDGRYTADALNAQYKQLLRPVQELLRPAVKGSVSSRAVKLVNFSFPATCPFKP
jgi:hypothetical protein